MIKLYPREMKNLSRILTIVLCFAPVAFASAGPVATTAGNNLTAYNPSNANNNQWAMMSNGRYDGNNTTAKADFGNCNALILRCAQPKCSNGGCVDYSVASAIVKGCVQSNSACKQYGADLEEYMSAQLVASSNAKINEQNIAAQQAAAAAATQQSQQQMQEMQYQMQQMQAQMAQQQIKSQQQLQAALAEQAAQSAAAIESMKSAATDAAKENEAGISAYQQEAIDRGISADILERQKITGQIMTELENAEVELKAVKTAMTTAFEYAKCDVRGNNCEGPKRVKKWRELASEFLVPYDETINKLYDALELAQLVGVNLSDIYMMLGNSCNRWGQYLCPRAEDGQIIYTETTSSYRGVPQVVDKDWKMDTECVAKCNTNHKCNDDSSADKKNCSECLDNCYRRTGRTYRPCTLLKMLTSDDEDAVYEGWVEADGSTANGNKTVVACASGALDSSKLFARRTKNKNGAGLVDIDKLETWLAQNEPRKTKNVSVDKQMAYCHADVQQDVLEKAVSSKSALRVNSYPLCVRDIKESMSDRDFKAEETDEECGFINPIFAICDTHLYNAGKASASDFAAEDTNDCTTSAKNGEEDGIKEATDKIVWAKKVGGKCEVQLCEADYEPIKKSGCRENKTDWAKDKSKYITAKQAHDRHINDMFGDMKEIIALKTTVISQQMYKQYEYLSATLRRLKTQLEKATLTATLEAAGAKTEEGSSSSGLAGSKNEDKTIYLAGADNCNNKMDYDAVYSCVQSNATLIINSAKSSTKKACNQLKETVKSFNVWAESAKIVEADKCLDTDVQCNKDEVQRCAQLLLQKVAKERADAKKQQSRINYGYMQQPQPQPQPAETQPD